MRINQNSQNQVPFDQMNTSLDRINVHSTEWTSIWGFQLGLSNILDQQPSIQLNGVLFEWMGLHSPELQSIHPFQRSLMQSVECCTSIRPNRVWIQSHGPWIHACNFVEVSNSIQTLWDLWGRLGMSTKALIHASNFLIKVSNPQILRNRPWNLQKHLKRP